VSQNPQHEGYTKHAATRMLELPEHEREYHAYCALLLVAQHDLRNEPLPYEATVRATGNCFVVVLRDRVTGRVEVQDMVPHASYFKERT